MKLAFSTYMSVHVGALSIAHTNMNVMRELGMAAPEAVIGT